MVLNIRQQKEAAGRDRERVEDDVSGERSKKMDDDAHIYSGVLY